MTVKFLITNNGTHPPYKWAEITADTILDLIQIDDTPTEDEAVLAARAEANRAKINVRPVLFNLLEGEFEKAQKDERKMLARHGGKRLDANLTPEIATRLDDVMPKLQTAFAATPFADHFAKHEVVQVLRNIVGQHIGNNMHIERSVHADKNPEAKESRAFRSRHHA